MYYKIICNNQIIDVIENIRYVKYLPKTKKSIVVDERQANGIVSSDGSQIYHLYGTKDTFNEKKLTVSVKPIEEEEYLRLTTQVKENADLANRVKELEILVQSLQELISKS